MKHLLFLLSMSFFGIFNSQNVGINTITPAATFDITGKPTDITKADGLIAPRFTLVQLNAKKPVYGIDQTGTIAYINDVSGTVNIVANPSIAQVQSIGYYYFNGTTWKPLEPKAGSVIFNATLGSGDGTALGQTIAQSSFLTVNLPKVNKNLGGGTWNAVNNTYTVPVNGTYLIKSSIRFVDKVTTAQVERNVFQAVNTSNIDTPEGIWQTNYTPATGQRRWTMLYNRFGYFTKGDVLRLYIYSDGAQALLSDAALDITLISTN